VRGARLARFVVVLAGDVTVTVTSPAPGASVVHAPRGVMREAAHVLRGGRADAYLGEEALCRADAPPGAPPRALRAAADAAVSPAGGAELLTADAAALAALLGPRERAALHAATWTRAFGPVSDSPAPTPAPAPAAATPAVAVAAADAADAAPGRAGRRVSFAGGREESLAAKGEGRAGPSGATAGGTGDNVAAGVAGDASVSVAADGATDVVRDGATDSATDGAEAPEKKKKPRSTFRRPSLKVWAARAPSKPREGPAEAPPASCPLSTGEGTRRVLLVRGKGRCVSV
jgi:hypothetical protein